MPDFYARPAPNRRAQLLVQRTMTSMLQAWRALARRPLFTLATLLTMTAGIGVTTSVFSIVDRVLIRPLAFPDAEQLVSTYEASPSRRERTSLVAPARLADWNRLNDTFEALSGSYSESVTDTSGGEPERLEGRRVMPRFFDVFAMAPLAGRTFVDDEERFGGATAAVISEPFWTRRFGRSPSAIGQRLMIRGKDYTIVGVMPRAFTSGLERTALRAAISIDVWIPAQLAPQLLQNRETRFLGAIGRMRRGVTLAQAQSDLARVQRQLGEQYPKTDKDWSAMVLDLKEVRIGEYRRVILFIFGAVALLLLIAVANVAGLMLVQREITYQEFLQWRARSSTLSEAYAVAFAESVVRTTEGLARLWGGTISGNTFTMLGTRAMLGRTLDAGDDGNPTVVVLSFDTWRRHFHSEPGIIGSTVEFRADFNASLTPEREAPRRLTVVGVLPAAFELPTGPMDFYRPFVVNASQRSPRVTVFGRLRPGVSLMAALDEANRIGNAVLSQPRSNALSMGVPRFDVRSVKEQMVADLRPALRVLLSAVGAVLLIVCANVANLLLARGTTRQREIAIRLAIGATRARVVRQILSECLLLALVGCALGAAIGAAGVTLVKHLSTVDAPGIFRLGFGTSILPRGHEVGIDLRLFAIAFAIAAITSLAFGVLPTLHISRTSSLHAMGSRGSGSGRRESRIRGALVVGQLVMATVLLVGAGLLISSFVKLSTLERGYDPANVLAFQLVLPPNYSVARKVDAIETLLSRLRALPNVAAAGFTRAGILIGEALTIGTFVPPGRTVDEMRTDPVRPLTRAVGAGYLTAVGARVLSGRDIEPADATGPVPAVVISRTVARRYFGNVSPVGQFLDWHVDKRGTHQVRVVGVVEDVRNESPDLAPNPEIFIEYRQLLVLQQRWGDSSQRQEQMAIGFLSFAVRTRGNPAAAAPAVARIVRSADPNVGIDAMIPMDRLVASSVARPRFYAVLLGVFAAVAGVLAAIGIYGVLAYAVTQRTQEIGIRMALGAQRWHVLALVLRKGVILTTTGIAVGLAVAAATTRLLQSMLFGVAPLDPVTFIAVSLMFGVVATLASYIPARRATKVDPMVALRSE